ncbi:MAG: recombinase [Acidimicrobiia bacterium]|nr:recombinase [Acidimicrobiia bacterium]
MTTSPILQRWYEQVGAWRPRIALADGTDERAIRAASQLVVRRLVSPVLVGPASEIRSVAAAGGISLDGTDIVDTDDEPLIVATRLVSTLDVAGCVAGARVPTADVIKRALRAVGTVGRPGLVSSSFFMLMPDDKPISYGDCGVIPDPNPEQLAKIAIATADSFRRLAGEEPRVAMLSFSTKGSATHPTVTKVLEALALVQSMAPDLAVDGELQFDAAWSPEIAAAKAPGSQVAGRANVFIFPNLDAGNLAYKITQRLGGARAYGPLIQGLNRPIHDLSRGCSVDDIVHVAVIAGIEAAASQEVTL